LASVGTALAGIELEIRSPEGVPLGARQHGEIWIKSPTIMTGYWRLPEATAAVLADGWYRTGDGGYLDEDGYLYLTDRIKDMIISGGENVYPAEVEEALRRHPAVFDAAVFGRKDDKWGEVVAAAVELAPGQRVTADALTKDLRNRLAGYKLPREIHFVDSLPRTASGKVQRGEVRSQFGRK
jgi:acyl-CoA synthetase (AMP-forming)/AMP-acid ligase II